MSELESDIDGLYARVDEMKKRIMAHSNEEIEKLKQQVIVLANEEAKRIVDRAKAEAEAESAEIAKQAEKSLAGIKKNIDSSFNRAVEDIVRTVLGETTPGTAQKLESKPTASQSKARKYATDGEASS